MEREKDRVLAPSVVARFQCKGAACRYSCCCYGWGIFMRRNEYRQWKKRGILPKGNQNNGKVRLREDGERTEDQYAEIVLTEEGNCPYFSADGLCQIQKEYGVGLMTQTCRIFPRKVNRYLDHAECSLSPGCERVLELLLEEKEGLLLEEGKGKSFEVYGTDYGAARRRKHPVLRYYYDVQILCLALLQEENMKMENRLLLLGMAVEKIEAFYKEGKGEQIAEYINDVLASAGQPESAEILEQFPESMPLAVFNSVRDALLTMDLPSSFREKILGRIVKGVETKRAENAAGPELEYYRECRERFSRWIKGKEYFLENVMVMFLLYSNIPFKDLEKSLWENYLYLVWTYVIVKGGLMMFLEEDSTDEDMIDFCAIMFRKLGHNDRRFQGIIEAYRRNGDTLAHVAILLRCL